MDSEIIVAVIAGLGTLTGTFGGIVASNRLTIYRLKELEKKVDKHNNIVERTYILEGKVDNACEKLKRLEEALLYEH